MGCRLPRTAFLSYLERGYAIVAFQRGDDDALPYYELARPAGPPPSTEPIA